MATKKDTVKIEINIAGEFIIVTVPFDRQDNIRDCERAINDLYAQWRKRFPRKTPSELLAMVAYQYALFYFDLKEIHDSVASDMKSLSDELDNLIDD